MHTTHAAARAALAGRLPARRAAFSGGFAAELDLDGLAWPRVANFHGEPAFYVDGFGYITESGVQALNECPHPPSHYGLPAALDGLHLASRAFNGFTDYGDFGFSLKSIAKKVGGAVKSAAKTVAKPVTTVAKAAAKPVVSVAKSVAPVLKPIGTIALKVAPAAMTVAAAAFPPAAPALLTAAALTAAGTKAVSAIKSGSVTGIVNAAAQAGGVFAPNTTAAIVNTVNAAKATVTNTVTQAKQTVTAAVAPVYTAATQTASSALTVAKSITSPISAAQAKVLPGYTAQPNPSGGAPVYVPATPSAGPVLVPQTNGQYAPAPAPEPSSGGGGLALAAAGAGAGFMVGGPVGAIVGAGAGLFLGK